MPGRKQGRFQGCFLSDFSNALLVKCWSDVGHHVGHAKKKGQDLHPDLVLRGGDDGIPYFALRAKSRAPAKASAPKCYKRATGTFA